MTLKIYVGTASELTARLAGAPSSTQTTVATAGSASIFTLAAATSFANGDSIVIGKEKGVISDLTGVTVTLEQPLKETPTAGATVRHYDADYTKYRDQSQPFTFIDDIKTGGRTGQAYGQDLVMNDVDGLMPDIVEQNRITIFDSVDNSTPLFAGVIVSSERIMLTKANGVSIFQWLIQCQGHQWEADKVGISEQAYVNINAGEFLDLVRSTWTNLSAGEIDAVSSPRLDYIRLSSVRRISEIGQSLSDVWPGSEFYIANGHTGGSVYFRQQVTSFAPITLSQSYLDTIGNRADQYVRIRTDYDKVYNMLTLPYYKEQGREPDFHVQTTTANEAFLKTSVTLAGQPSNIEESQLLFDDFSDGALDTDFLEYDVTNPSPPTGFNSADGYLVEGAINSVDGLHLLDTAAASPAVKLGDVGRVTDPAETEPFTGAERQTIMAKEVVVNTLGDAVILGITDQSTIQTYITIGFPSSTTTRLYVDDSTLFMLDDRITVRNQKTYVTAVGQTYIDVSALSSAPPYSVNGVRTAVSKHPLALSRIKFGVYFKSTGDLKYILNGVETAFGTPRTYTTATYSLRLHMECFETTIASGVSANGCTLTSATNFATGDVVELYTSGSRSAPERRVITVSGSNITYLPTTNTPAVGYRVRTMPKMVLQIKGGAYGSITGRTWTTIYTAVNTWQTSADADRDDHGVLLASHKSLVGTVSLFQMKNPPGITANIGSTYLHIGTQEIDSSEPDTDCIVRKVGSHYQLDFFPDTKNLWASGTTLELRYKELWRLHLEAKDLESMRSLAKVRGYSVTDGTTEQALIRFGGQALDGIEILPNPLNDPEALAQAGELLSAVKDPAYTAEIATNTVMDTLCRAGQTIASTIPGIPDLLIERVEITEIPGIQDASGSSVYRQKILAGTYDRLSEFLQKRAITSGKRIVIDDGLVSDSFTRVQQAGFSDSVKAADSFSLDECASPSNVVYDGAVYSAFKCLQICTTTGPVSGSSFTQVTTSFLDGSTDWSNISNIASADGINFATCTMSSSDFAPYTSLLFAKGFNLSIPSDRTIFGFKIEILIKASRNDSVASSEISFVGLTSGGVYADPFNSLLYANTENTAESKAISTDLEYIAYSIAAGNFGFGLLTPALVNDSSFGVGFYVTPDINSGTLTISTDHVRLTVFHS